MVREDASGYHYTDAVGSHSNEYLLPTVLRLLDDLNLSGDDKRLFDLGCGNGNIAQELFRRGWDVTRVDPSSEGIERARHANPKLKLFCGSAYDDLTGQYGRFPVVLSLEVVGYVYSAPRLLAHRVQHAEPWWKGYPLHAVPRLLEEPDSSHHRKMGAHFAALWDHGHIKFWSMATLGELLREVGFDDTRYERVGRIARWRSP